MMHTSSVLKNFSYSIITIALFGIYIIYSLMYVFNAGDCESGQA